MTEAIWYTSSPLDISHIFVACWYCCCLLPIAICLLTYLHSTMPLRYVSSRLKPFQI